MANNIYIGTSKTKNIYIGTQKVKKIYCGTEMIWQSAIPIARPTPELLNPYATYSGTTISNGFSMTGVEYVSGDASGMNAGAYVAYYRPDADHIWEDTEDRALVAVTLTINTRSIAGAVITLDGSLTYNAEQQTQGISSVVISDLSATYSVSGNTGTNAGSYTLTCTGTGNFSGSQTKDWSIAKATGSASGGYNASPTYNGEWQWLIAGCTGTGSIVYSVDLVNWSPNCVALDATSANIYYKATESANYTESPAVGPVWCNMNKATGSCSGGYNASPTYNGTEQALIAGCTGTGTIEYSTDLSYWYTDTPSSTAVADYNIYYRARESTNYTASAVVGPVACNLNPLYVDLTISNWTDYFSTSNFSFSSNLDGYPGLLYSASIGRTASSLKTFSIAGNVKVRLIITASATYSRSAETQLQFLLGGTLMQDTYIDDSHTSVSWLYTDYTQYLGLEFNLKYTNNATIGCSTQFTWKVKVIGPIAVGYGY